MKVQQTIVVKCPNLSVPYRRLVCYCRLYEVQDKNKKDRPGKQTFYLLLLGMQGSYHFPIFVIFTIYEINVPEIPPEKFRKNYIQKRNKNYIFWKYKNRFEMVPYGHNTD